MAIDRSSLPRLKFPRGLCLFAGRILAGGFLLLAPLLSTFSVAGSDGWVGQAPLKEDKSDGDVTFFEGRPVAADRLLVKLKVLPQVKSDSRATLAAVDLEPVRDFENFPGLKVVRLAPLKKQARLAAAPSLTEKIAELRTSGLFEYVEPDWRVSALQVPADSAFADGTLWGLRNTGQSGGVAGVDINAVQAWSLTTGDPSVVIGVIDSGVRYTHQDLAGNMWTNPGEIPGNGIDDDGNSYVDDVYGINAINGSGDPMDDNDHGTHCAGTIAASANDAGRLVGVAYGSKIMALKFLAADGFGSTSDAITCIDYALSQGVDILSNSWGGGGYSQALRDAIAAARDAGVLFVAAAGNEASDNDSTPSYPANYNLPNVISVAAIDRTGALASFSNYGRSSVDIAAPGVSILSSTSTSDSSYASFGGTSMATPHVAGVAALLVSLNPSASVEELRNRILQSAVPLDALDGRILSGGMIDAYGAAILSADGELEIRANVEGSLEPGGDGVFSVLVTDLFPITGATVSGSLAGGAPVTFRDNGVSPDEAADDGFYTASLAVPMGSASVELTVNATAPGKVPAGAAFVFPVVLRPGNDDFADRVILVDGTVQVSGSNESATAESGEPVNPSVAGGRTIWYQWTAAAGGSATVSTAGSGFDTTLAVYTGSSLGGLSLVGSNDDFSGLQSAVVFSATAGVTYQIQVDGYAGSQGKVVLNYPSPGVGGDAPLIITQPSGRNIVVGDSFTLGVEAVGVGPLGYQWFLDGAAISGAGGSSYSVASAVIDDQGSYTVTVSNSAGSVTSQPAFVSVNAVGLLPENDEFSAATVLSGASGRVDATNSGATGQVGEPDHAGLSAPLSSVWFAWTAPADGVLTVDTFGSNFDTTLAAYTGSAIGALSEIAANDDSGGSQSRVMFAVTEGVTYRLAVDGYGSAEGAIGLNYGFASGGGLLPNDLFADRLDIPAGGGVFTGSNVGAGGETGEPSHAGVSSPLASLWWTWTSPADGVVTVDTFGSDFDTTLAVYRGATITALTRVVSNDDSGDLQSEVSFAASAGTDYQIAVDGYASSEGSVRMTLEPSWDNVPPLADAGADISVDDLDDNGIERIVLDASGSVDPDGSLVSWQWRWSGGGSASGETASVDFSVGVHEVTLTVTDDQGERDTDTVRVEVNGFLPQIGLSGNGLAIASGDRLPRTADGTDFGEVVSPGGFAESVFRLSNSGPGTLIATIADNSNHFVVTGFAGSVPSGDYDDFTVRFVPGSEGVKTALIQIAGNDPDYPVYSFEVRGVGMAADDSYEENDSLVAAYGGLLPDVWLSDMEGPGVQLDEDWYRIEVPAPALGRIVAECLFSQAQGDIDLELLNAEGVVIGRSASTTDNETIDSLGIAPGTYYLRVYYGDEGGTYDLRWREIAPPAPEIAVTGNGANIADGDTSPTVSDGTDFGSADLASGPVSRTFRVSNSGTASLTVFASTAAADFGVTGLSSPIAPGAHDDFTVTFEPTSVGTKTATITIGNNDADEDPFTFMLVGEGTEPPAPEIAVTGNGVNIADGDTSPTVSDGTDFGSADLASGPVSRTFRVSNSGTASLTVFASTGSADFSVTGLSSPIAPGAHDDFTVTFEPTSAGPKTATITIGNNDADEDPFTFMVTGEGTIPDDFGDDRFSAGQLDPGSSLSGTIGEAGDRDVFELEVVEAGELTVWTEGALDTVGTLMDSAGEIIDSNDDGGDQLNFRILETVPAGTYYIEVRGISATTGAYLLQSSFSSTPTGSSFARPEGWHWTEGEWEWSDSRQSWYWIPPGLPFLQNMTTSQVVARPVNGWNYYEWPYFWNATEGVWYYIFQGNLPYVLNPDTGEWRRWGE